MKGGYLKFDHVEYNISSFSYMNVFFSFPVHFILFSVNVKCFVFCSYITSKPFRVLENLGQMLSRTNNKKKIKFTLTANKYEQRKKKEKLEKNITCHKHSQFTHKHKTHTHLNICENIFLVIQHQFFYKWEFFFYKKFVYVCVYVCRGACFYY